MDIVIAFGTIASLVFLAILWVKAHHTRVNDEGFYQGGIQALQSLHASMGGEITEIRKWRDTSHDDGPENQPVFGEPIDPAELWFGRNSILYRLGDQKTTVELVHFVSVRLNISLSGSYKPLKGEQKNIYRTLYNVVRDAGFRIRFRRKELLFSQRLEVALLPHLLLNWMRLINDFASICLMRVAFAMTEMSNTTVCVFCKEELNSDDKWLRCLKCGSPHHNDCFKLHGKCAVFGCAPPESKN